MQSVAHRHVFSYTKYGYMYNAEGRSRSKRYWHLFFITCIVLVRHCAEGRCQTTMYVHARHKCKRRAPKRGAVNDVPKVQAVGLIECWTQPEWRFAPRSPLLLPHRGARVLEWLCLPPKQ